MRVFHPSGRNHTVLVAPGAEHSDVSDWKDEKGNPRRFDIKFVDGVASVDAKMADYLIEKGYAQRTALKRVTNTLVRAFG